MDEEMLDPSISDDVEEFGCRRGAFFCTFQNFKQKAKLVFSRFFLSTHHCDRKHTIITTIERVSFSPTIITLYLRAHECMQMQMQMQMHTTTTYTTTTSKRRYEP
jgi:hypothetical protein